MSDKPAAEEQADDPLLSPEEDAILDAVWDSIDFDDVEGTEDERADSGE